VPEADDFPLPEPDDREAADIQGRARGSAVAPVTPDGPASPPAHDGGVLVGGDVGHLEPRVGNLVQPTLHDAIVAEQGTVAGQIARIPGADEVAGEVDVVMLGNGSASLMTGPFIDDGAVHSVA